MHRRQGGVIEREVKLCCCGAEVLLQRVGICVCVTCGRKG